MTSLHIKRQLEPKTLAGRCGACEDGGMMPFAFTMAFQPIVDVLAGRILAYEALVRGPSGESAASVLGQITPANRYAFDQSCRVKAISLASRLGLARHGASLSINFIPGAMYRPENCVRTTVAAAKRHQFPVDRLIFEMTENEQIRDFALLDDIFRVYRANHFRTALDDFGAGYSGLGLLAQFPFDIVKIDMGLLRGLQNDCRRHAIVRAIAGMAAAVDARLIAEGVETAEELAALRALGVSIFQGYLFAKPGFEALPEVAF